MDRLSLLRNLAVAARGIWMLLAGIIVLAGLAVGALFMFDQPAGHRLVVAQIEAFKFKSGLAIRVGSLEGSIFGKLRITGLTLSDPRGVFLEVPVVDLDWRPRDLLANRIQIQSAIAADALLVKLPDLDPTDDPNILPDIDIFIGRLHIERLRLGPKTGAPGQVVRVAANADIHEGRALVNLSALSGAAGDTVLVKLDIEPDRNRFDVDARINAVATGALVKLTGLGRPFGLELVGDGSWRQWNGRLRAQTYANAVAVPLAALKLTGNDGRFTIDGQVTPGTLLDGVAARLARPAIAVAAELTFADRQADIEASLTSAALEISSAGKIDFASETFKGFAVDAVLLRPQDIDPRLSGTRLRLQSRLAGKLAMPLVDYLLTGTALRFDTLIVDAPRVSGVVQLGRTPLVVPVTASARRITGAGAAVDPWLANVRVDTRVALPGSVIEAREIRFRSDGLSATGAARLTPATGAYTATLNATLPRHVVPGLGVAGVTATVAVTGGASGVQARGAARIAMARLDNAALLRLTGGLPVIDTRFDWSADGTVALRETRISAPGLTLAGNGALSPAGVLRIEAAGQSREFGPVTLNAAGLPERLRVELKLARPGFGMDITRLSARAVATAGGWNFDADAQSRFGPVTALGSVATATGPLAIDIGRLTVMGVAAQGRLVQTAGGPFAGRLEVVGKGLAGAALLSAAGTVQAADIEVDVHDASFALAAPVTVGKGQLRARIRLPQGNAPVSIDASFALANLRRGDLIIHDAGGKVDFVDGQGRLDLALKGDAGVPFAMTTTANLAGNRLVLNATGAIAGAPLKLDHPAELVLRDGNWQLSKTAIVTPRGRIQIGGSFGDDLELHLQLDRVGLGLARIINPALDLSGTVSGGIDFSYAAADPLPRGRAELRVNGLSRAGVGTSATRIDLGINALLANGRASARMVIAREGNIEGRAQAQLATIPGSREDPLLTRLLAAPLFAQLRWAGPSQALWPLAGVDRFDIRGPVSVAIDGSGVLGDPNFVGAVKANGARIESTGIGLVLDRIDLESRFTGSRLEITRFTAGAGRDGTISARGGIDLSAVRNFPMDFTLDMRNALLINRDDLRGAATGSVRIHSDADGARISGKLDIDQARIALGATSVADVPTMVVTEINGTAAKRPIARPVKPTIWQLDLDVDADNRLMVRGMGLDSEWSADVRVTGSIEKPRVTGKVTLVRGDYDFAGKRFALTRGDVRFTGNYPPDPIINIVAENTSSNFTATLKITGTAQRPQISFSSIPALPEDEVLSRVLFGESITNLSAPEAIQLAGALATLRGGNGGLNPINAIRKGLGIDRLRILPADTTRGRKTSIAAGQYIGDRVYVEITTDAQGFTATSVEVSLTRSLSILSEIATLGGTSLNVRWKRDY